MLGDRQIGLLKCSTDGARPIIALVRRRDFELVIPAVSASKSRPRGVAITPSGRGTTEFIVVQNWTEELRRRLPARP